MMRNLRFFTVLLFFVFCAGSLYAQTEQSQDYGEYDESYEQSDEETPQESRDHKGPPWEIGHTALFFPTASVYGGNKEYLSCDAGFEFLFTPDGNFLETVSIYAQTGFGTDFGDVNLRFTGGFGFGLFMSMLQISIGAGVELSPCEKPVTVVEGTFKLFFLNAKMTALYTDEVKADSGKPDTKFYLGVSLERLYVLIKVWSN